MVMSLPATRTDLQSFEPGLSRVRASPKQFPSVGEDSAGTEGSAPGEDALRRGAFDLVRRFVEQKSVTEGVFGDDRAASELLDWEAVEAAAAGARSLEQAVGHALLIALRMSRPRRKQAVLADRGPHLTLETGACTEWAVKADDPFFAFSVADIVPDFGDASRYRSKVARRVARVIGIEKRSDER